MRYMSGLDSVPFQPNYRADLHFLFHCFPRKKLFSFLFFFFSVPLPSPTPRPKESGRTSPRHQAGPSNPGSRGELPMGVNIWATCPDLGNRGLGGRAGFRFLPRGSARARGGLGAIADPGPSCSPSGGPRRGASSRRSPRSWPRRAAGLTASTQGQRRARRLPRLLRSLAFPSAARESAARGAAFVGRGSRGPLHPTPEPCAGPPPPRGRGAPFPRRRPRKRAQTALCTFAPLERESEEPGRANAKGEGVIYGRRVEV